MSASPAVLVSRENRVLAIQLNRPDKKNALDRPMYAALSAALREADADPAIGAVLLRGVPGAFCAGNDITDFVAFARTGERPVEIEEFLLALARVRKPLVAAVDGLAIGIGTTLLMHCDHVVASPGSTFRTPFVDLGITPEAGSSLLGPRLMGHQRAFSLLVAGEPLDGAGALAANLVTRLSEDPDRDAGEAAARIAAKPPEALALSRELLRGPREELEERIRIEVDRFSERLRSGEAQAAFAAFFARSKS